MASGSKKVILAALVGNSAIAVTKFFAAFTTGSAAMLSEAIHSLVDTGNQGLLLHGMRKAKQPADARFPFGHGKEIYFWSFIVAILIFAAGAGVSIYEGVHHLLHPTPPGDPFINYVVLGLAMVFESGALFMAAREFNAVRGGYGWFEAVARGKDPTLFVVLFEDSAAMLGLVVAGLGVWLSQVTGSPVWDGLASVTIGLILAGTAIWLAYETKGLLIGESATEVVRDSIREIVNAHDHVSYVSELLTLHMGPEFILLNLGVEFHPDLTADGIAGTIESIEDAVKDKHPAVQRIFVEAGRRPALARNS
jgi:cation diffusion facilitator family transporter